MEKFERIKAKVKRVLVDEFGSVSEEDESVFFVECNNESVGVSFIQHSPSDEEGRIFLEVAGLAATVVSVDEKLTSWIAFHGGEFLIGTFILQELFGGAQVVFRYRMLADDIDPNEIYVAVYAVAESIAMYRNQFEDGFSEEGNEMLEVTPELLGEIKEKALEDTPDDQKQFAEARWLAALDII